MKHTINILLILMLVFGVSHKSIAQKEFDNNQRQEIADNIELLMQQFAKSLKKIDLTFLILGIFVIFLRWMVESIILVILGDGKVLTLRRAFSTIMIGQFFNSITPFATGGQPAQVYYMSKLGLDVSDGVALLTGKFIIYQLVLTFYSLGILIFKFKEVAREVPTLPFLSFAGFLLNTSIIFLLVLFSYKPAITRKLVGFILKILKKLKLKVFEEAVFDKLSMFHEIMKDYISRPFLLISVFSLTFLQLLLNFSIPYFVGLSLGVKNISYSKVIAFQSVLLNGCKNRPYSAKQRAYDDILTGAG